MDRNVRSVFFDITIPAVTGTIVAVTIIPFSFLALVAFLVAASIQARIRIRAGRTGLATACALAGVLIFGGVITSAALYRPAKVEEQLLKREIRLPSKQLTLAEIASTQFDRRSFPLRIAFRFADVDKDQVVELPRQKLTLAEFLDAIERQTVLRRRFSHCGNGFTVLTGGDCSFGLYVRDPELAVGAQEFDVYAHAWTPEEEL